MSIFQLSMNGAIRYDQCIERYGILRLSIVICKKGNIPLQTTHLSALFPCWTFEVTANLVVSFQLEKQAIKPHFQLKLNWANSL